MKVLKGLLIGAALMAVPAFAGPYDAWAKHRVIKISTLDTAQGGAGVATDIHNFPVVVRLSSASLAAGSDVLSEAGTGGASIRFTTASGDTALSYEIDTWTATSAAIWVKVPRIKGNDSTKVRMYWGNASAVSESNGRAVFDTANGYRAVWHMGNSAATSPRPNSTYFSNLTLRPRNFTASNVVQGVIGMADTLTGGQGGLDTLSATTTYFIADYNNLTGNDTTALMFPGGKHTFSLWARHGPAQGFSRYYNFQNSAPGGIANAIAAIPPTLPAAPTATGASWHFRWNGATSNTYTGAPTGAPNQNSGGGLFRSTDSQTVANNGWQHVTATTFRVDSIQINDSTWVSRDSLVKFVDGRQVTATYGGSGGTLIPLPAARRPYAFIGRTFENDNDRTFDGTLDEIQFLNASVSRDWMRLSYRTQRPNPTAVTMSASILPPPPNAPTAVTAVPANAAAVVTWTPATTGSPAAQYIVTSSPAGSAGNCITSSNFCLFTGLTTGTAYTFTVTPTNSSGDGTASAPSAAVTPVTTGPAAPTPVTATPNNGSVAVSWTAVGAATGGYRVFSLPGNHTCGSLAGTSCVVSGLTNGTAYTFRVLGRNNTEYGSTGTASATPATVPGAPTNASATVSAAGVVTLNWTAPANNGGSAITGYSVDVSGGPGACVPTGAATTCTATGLTFGATYIFTIKANNAIGPSTTGAQAEAIPAARPTAPSAVAVVTPIPTTGAVGVTWTASNPRGSALTGYNVYRSTTPNGALTAHCTSTGAATTCTGNVPATGSYCFRVSATNALGVSDTSAAMTTCQAVTSLAQGFAQGHYGFVGQNRFQVTPAMVSLVEKVTIVVADMQGRTVWSKSVHPARDGVSEIVWNKAQGFNASGMFMINAAVTVEGGQVQTQSRKMVIADKR